MRVVFRLLARTRFALAAGLLLTGAGTAPLRLGGTDPPARPPAAETTNPPRVDRFGDPLPEGAIARLGTMRLRHANGMGVVFDPDGKSLWTCGADRTIRNWDLTSGRLLREQLLSPGVSSPTAVLSPDARILAFEEWLGSSVVLWDVRGNKRLRTLSIGSQWPRVVFSPDGKRLVTAEDEGALRVWDIATGKGRKLGKHPRRIYSLSFAADGTLLTVADDSTIRFWDLAAGRERSRLTLAKPVPGAALSPDGRVVAVTSHWDMRVRFLDAASGEPVKDWKEWDGVKGRNVPYVQFAPDGKTVLIAAEDGVIIWNPRIGKAIHTLPGRYVHDFAFSPDGKTAASLGAAIPGGFSMASVVRVWDLTTGAAHEANAPARGHLGAVDGVAFSPDGEAIVSACDADPILRVWDASTGRPLRSLPMKDGIVFHNLSYTPDGKELLLGTTPAIVRLDAATGRELRRYVPDKKGKEVPDVVVMRLRDDGRTLLAVSQYLEGQVYKFTLQAWDLSSGDLLRSAPLIRSPQWIAYSHFTPDGRLLVIPPGSVHDTHSGEELARLDAKGESLDSATAISADGALIAMGVRAEVDPGRSPALRMVAVQIWETATLSPVARLATGEAAHLAFTPDGRGLVTAGPDALTLWDIASGQPLVRRPAPGRYQGRYGPSFACSLTLSTDGRTAATGNADTTILLWDLTPPAAKRAAPLTAAQREACWANLASDDAGRAFAAIGQLADDPQRTVSMLRDRQQPVKAPPVEEMRRLIADLDAGDFERREAATRRLAELGGLVQRALREALGGKPSLEVRRRIEGLLAESWRTKTPEERRSLRAIRVLEAIGTAEARRVLEKLAGGAPDAHLTREAKAALARRGER